MQGMMVLEDGSSFDGITIGAAGEAIGQVVLNTSVVGYQEIMTDPANAGKIVVFTYPLIGNYGVARKFSESGKAWLAGIAIKEKSRKPSNWQAENTFDDFLQGQGLIGITEVDTRAVTITLRQKGEMYGIITGNGGDKKGLAKRIAEFKKGKKRGWIKDISVKEVTEVTPGATGPVIGILDLGMMRSFQRQLEGLGCSIRLIPYDMGAEALLGMGLDGLVISNGPEEDSAIPQIVENVSTVLGRIPLLGIALGHEIIGLAIGGARKRMHLGHHGVNYPVKSPSSFNGAITVQNHSWVLEDESLEGRSDVAITLRNGNDDSIEEMESKALRFISAQYYPVSPGFDEIHGVFRRFLALVTG